MKRLGVILLCLLSLAVKLPAQTDSLSAEFAGIFRGKLPSLYSFVYNGTYFWDQKAFQKGDVWYNGKLYRNISMNVDACTGELLVRPLENATAVVVFRDQVAWFTLGDKLFVNLQYLGWPQAPEGLLEVIRNGRAPLLRRVSKQLQTDTHGNAYINLGIDVQDYNTQIPQYFHRSEQNYVLEGGQLRKISKRGLKKRLREAPGEPAIRLDNVTWHSEEARTEGAYLTPVNLPGTGNALPENYFTTQQQDTLEVQYVNTAQLATYRNKVYTVGDPALDKGQALFTVSGSVTEAETGDKMPAVLVYDQHTGTYTRTGAQGQYKLKLPKGENVLHFSADGKEDLDLKVVVHSDGGLNVMMTDKVTMIREAVVSAESMAQHRDTKMGMEKVSAKTLNKIPSAFGEGDVIKAVLTLPGVKSVGEASGGFNVRGGNADQNLVLFNGNTLYNPSHLFGIFSAFNPDFIADVELYKSSIPAEYGGRVSSVLQVDAREGDLQRWRGSVGIGLLTSRAQVEGPLVKGKTSINAAARTSYTDWMLKLLPKNSAYSGGSAGFTDANLGITHRIDGQNTLQAFAYYATDRFAFGGDTTFRYGNLNASLVWKRRTELGRFQLSAGYDQYGNKVSPHAWETGAYDLETYIRQAFLRLDRKRRFSSHEVAYGLHLTGFSLDPGILEPYGSASTVASSRLDREQALEPALYLADTWKPAQELSLEGGVRLESYYNLNHKQFYALPDLRLSAKYSPVENLSFKAGVNSLTQFIHLISNTSAVSPMDTWKLSDANIRPTWGWQAAGGVYWTELNTGIDFSAEAYYKRSVNELDYKPGAVLSMNPELYQDLLPVFGRAWGVELMARKTTGSITGWISYSYSRAHLQEMQDRGNQTLAGGNWYNAPYDKPHELKLVANWAITHRYSVSLNLDYSTGRPVTVPMGMYYYAGAYRMAYSERNAYRIPDYFRMDLAFNIDPGHYLKAFLHTTLTLGVYNVTGRKNPYSVFFKNNNGVTSGYLLSVFAAPIPYINLNLLF